MQREGRWVDEDKVQRHLLSALQQLEVAQEELSASLDPTMCLIEGFVRAAIAAVKEAEEHLR